MPLQLYDRDRILDACLVVFARYGYERTSTGMLAEAAGISKALIFHHFTNKKELYFSVLDRCFERARLELGVEALPDSPDFFQAMAAFSLTKLRYYQQNPDLSKVVREAFHGAPDELKAEIEVRYGALIVAKNRVLERLFAKVPLRPGIDRDWAFELIMLTLDHFENSYLARASTNPELDDQYVEQFLSKMNAFLVMIRHGIEGQ